MGVITETKKIIKGTALGVVGIFGLGLMYASTLECESVCQEKRAVRNELIGKKYKAKIAADKIAAAKKAKVVVHSTEPCNNMKQYAYNISKEFVKRALRSPATANFPWRSDATTYLGNCTYRVSGHVDSQNGFGALVRTKYSITLAYTPSNRTWIKTGSTI